MRGARALVAASLAAAALVTAAASSGAADTDDRKGRQTLFVGIDTSGSFRTAGYDDALTFLAYYIYGHLNELGGLAKTRELFVAGIGGRQGDEPKAFHPIHDFRNKSVGQIESDLKRWFPPNDTFTDFNAFFHQVARIAKERNLVLTPITVMVVTDGVPDLPHPNYRPGSTAMYQQIDMSALEYLSKNVTVRLAYTSPKVGDNWRRYVPHNRVRLWAVDGEVMRGWRAQMRPDTELARQDRLWKWVRENVDFRVRSRGI